MSSIMRQIEPIWSRLANEQRKKRLLDFARRLLCLDLLRNYNVVSLEAEIDKNNDHVMVGMAAL